MSIRNLTCIGCPMGCALQVEMINGEVTKVTGNTCKRGADYGRKECTNPTRIVTSSVTVVGGKSDVVPVKTESDVPKDKIFDIIKEIKNISVKAPVQIGDIILKDVLGTGVNIIATKNVN